MADFPRRQHPPCPQCQSLQTVEIADAADRYLCADCGYRWQLRPPEAPKKREPEPRNIAHVRRRHEPEPPSVGRVEAFRGVAEQWGRTADGRGGK
jgi:ribosomal protein S27AE